MRATPEVLEDNRVRLTIEIDEQEVEEALATTAKTLAQQVRIPGFRPGRAPRQVVEARLGGPRALRSEALRELLPDYYARALSATELEPISPPELSVTSGEEDGAVGFDAVVEVRPEVHLTGYGAMRVAIPSPLASDVELDQLLDTLRETDAELTAVARPIATGDYVTMDVRGRDDEGEEQVAVDDIVYLVGQGTIVDTADEQLVGMRAGETLEVAGTTPTGRHLSCTFTLKEVRERVLPELTDEWVQENTDYESAQELRDRSLERIGMEKLARARRAMRDATLGELASQVGDDQVPEALLDTETRDRAEDLERNLAASNLALEAYLQATHLTTDQLLEMLREDAKHAIKVDLALRAVAHEEGIESTAEELDEELARLAAARKERPQRLREQLVRAGRMGALRSSLTKSKAVDWVVERATFVDETGSEIDRDLLEGDPGVSHEQVDQNAATAAETEEAT